MNAHYHLQRASVGPMEFEWRDACFGDGCVRYYRVPISHLIFSPPDAHIIKLIIARVTHVMAGELYPEEAQATGKADDACGLCLL